MGADEAVKVRKIQVDYVDFEKKKEKDITEQTAREEEGAVSSEMMEAHRNSIIEIEELIDGEQTRAEMEHAKVEATERAVFDRKETLAIQTVTDRRIMAADNVQRIQRDTLAKIRNEETSWQQRAARWTGVARRKVDLKEVEDAEQQTAKRRRKRRG